MSNNTGKNDPLCCLSCLYIYLRFVHKTRPNIIQLFRATETTFPEELCADCLVEESQTCGTRWKRMMESHLWSRGGICTCTGGETMADWLWHTWLHSNSWWVLSGRRHRHTDKTPRSVRGRRRTAANEKGLVSKTVQGKFLTVGVLIETDSPDVVGNTQIMVSIAMSEFCLTETQDTDLWWKWNLYHFSFSSFWSVPTSQV